MNIPVRISIIDDDAAVRDSTMSLLRSLGYAAATFDSAESFLDSRDYFKASCILTDIRMPGMGGIALQVFLTRNGYTTPIIFMTAFPDEITRKLVLDAGACGYLVKPYNEARLVNCIEKALQQH